MNNVISNDMSVSDFLDLYNRFQILGETLVIDDIQYLVKDNEIYLCGVSKNYGKEYIVSNFITMIDSMAFMDSTVKSFILGNSVKSIGAYCFSDSTLNSVELNSDIVLNRSAFESCLYLKEIINSHYIKSVGQYCFYKTARLKRLNLSNADFIDSFAFLNSSVEELVLKSDVVCKKNTFFNMLHLSTVYIKGKQNIELENLLKDEKFNVKIQYI